MCIFGRPAAPPPPAPLPPAPTPPTPPQTPPPPKPLDTDVNPKILLNRTRKQGSKKTNLNTLQINMPSNVSTTGAGNTGGLNP